MIIILSNREDITADYVILELRKRKVDFFRFNTEDFPLNVKLSLNYGTTNFLQTPNNKIIPFSDIQSIWYRRPILPDFNKFRLEKGVEDFCTKESFAALEGAWTLLDCNWVSNPFNIRKAEIKPFQLSVASEIGFKIPKTLISNDSELIKNFYLKNNKCTIVKPIKTSVVKKVAGEDIIFTSSVQDFAIEKVSKCIPIPSIFQERLPKKYDIRVTVIGEQVFPVEIHSQDFRDSMVDWRQGENPKIKHLRHELPKDISDKCLQLNKRLGLKFSAIDFVFTPNGDYYFLEINPNGQWAWIEERTGYKLTESLVDLLCLEK
ncbi:MAG: hypothetical protein QY316_12990 [Thermodesulfobacteriota bacterium]|nr:MAG: hypothetical protein QY316_12990 [Thermodesulfobacteriota bacterium]